MPNSSRIEPLQAKLTDWQIDVLIIDNPIDLFYLTGQQLSLGRLVVASHQAMLCVDGRYYEGCERTTQLPLLLNRGYDEKSAFIKWWPYKGKRVGFDSQTTSYADSQLLSLLNSTLVPLSSPIAELRAVKERREIELLRAAAELGSRGYDYLLSCLKEGVSEKELALQLEFFWRKQGGEKLAFDPHIAFGENSSQPHYHVSDRKLKMGETVLFDIGVVLAGYYSDMTRIVAFHSASEKMREIYTIVYEAMQRALEICRPGVSAGDLDHAARSWIASKGYGDHFSHSLGHGVGLEIHEEPVLRSGSTTQLVEGMVITIEPGIYLPGVGGVRLEDTVVLTKKGFENLTDRSLTSSLPIV